MSDTPTDASRFSDEEAHEILRRAVSIEHSAVPGGGVGLSLTELQDAGAEAGIDPARVQQAALEVARERRPTPGRRLGVKRLIDVERVVDGAIGDGDVAELIATIRRAIGTPGQSANVHGVIEWSASSEAAERLVTMSTRDDRTTVRASSNLTGLATITFLPPTLVGTISAFIAFTQAAEASHELGMLMCVMAVPALLVVLRFIYGALASSEAEKLQALVDQLAQSIQDEET